MRSPFLLLTVGAALFAAAPAAAASLALATDPPAPSDRAPMRLLASGNADSANATVTVRFRAAGSGQCGPNPGADNGQGVDPDGSQVGPGQFSVAGALRDFTAGSYLFCAWLTDNSGDPAQPLAAVSATVNVTAADTLALSVSDPDPVEGRGLDLHATGTSYDPNGTVFATSRTSGGACAASPTADPGTQLVPDGAGTGAAPFDLTLAAAQILGAASYLDCAWLVNADGTPLATASKAVTVRGVQASLALKAPAQVDVGDLPAVTATAHADWGVPMQLFADMKPAAGASCAPTHDQEPTNVVALAGGQQLVDQQQPSGDVSMDVRAQPAQKPGAQLICAWLVAGWQGAGADKQLAGPASARVTAVAPLLFSGLTRQHRPLKISFAPVLRQIYGIDYTDRYRCSRRVFFSSGFGYWNGVFTASLSQQNFGALKVRANGAFAAKLDADPLNRFAISGRVSGKTVTGTLHGEGRSDNLVATNQRVRCHTGTVRFKLRAH